jgi:thioredoxin 1
MQDAHTTRRELDNESNGMVQVGKLNIYPNMPIAWKYTVMTAPVLMLFKGGEPVLRLQGFHPRERILTEVESRLTTE